jgi:hypothetical protein
MKTVTILAAMLIGLTPLPISHSFQTLNANTNTNVYPITVSAPSLPALTPPLFQRTPTFHGTLPTAPTPVSVPETTAPVPEPEPSEGLIPVLPIEEGTEDDMAIQPTPGRSED